SRPRGRTSCGARDAGDSTPGAGGGMCLSSARAIAGVKAAANTAHRVRTAGRPGTRPSSRGQASADPSPCGRPAIADGEIFRPEEVAVLDIVMRSNHLGETALRPPQTWRQRPEVSGLRLG